jgi:hypothetical protein
MVGGAAPARSRTEYFDERANQAGASIEELAVDLDRRTSVE